MARGKQDRAGQSEIVAATTESSDSVPSLNSNHVLQTAEALGIAAGVCGLVTPLLVVTLEVRMESPCDGDR